MANLPLAFGELLVGAILIDAGIKGDAIANVVKGVAKQHPLPQDAAAAGGPVASDPLNAAAAGAAAGSGGYVNPVPGASASRVDMGVDYTLPQGGHFLAPGDSIIKAVDNRSGFGNYIAATLTSGPLAGHSYYVAEGVTPAVSVGQTVKAGTPIANAYGGPYGYGVIEAGWADPSISYDPLAKITGGYQEGDSTAAGASFNRFVQSLGGTLGHLVGSTLGTLSGKGLP